MTSNETEGVCYPQPRTLADRVAIARDFTIRQHYEIPLLVDSIANDADRIYAGWPERFYVLDARGKILYKGEMGPFGFDPEEVDAFLRGL